MLLSQDKVKVLIQPRVTSRLNHTFVVILAKSWQDPLTPVAEEEKGIKLRPRDSLGTKHF